jgi:uncharacterized 2Fe-2S/4Fe-4S cluster protein (DUF4445 family)
VRANWAWTWSTCAGVREREGQREFVLVSEEEQDRRPAITFTQKDVRELQLAKGAMRTGIQVLLEASGQPEEDIDQVIIEGMEVER